MRFNKGLTSQDHAIREVANPAAQSFRQGKLAVLFLYYSLSDAQVKSRMIATLETQW
jgi:hypothetical protein